MLGSLDGEIIELATGRKGIYEGKTAMIQNSQQYQVWKNGVPYNYLIQVLWIYYNRFISPINAN